MKTLALTVLSLGVGLTEAGRAQELAVPPVVAKGFEKFQKNGTLAGMGVWLAGSARGNDEDQDRAAGKMGSIKNYYGRMLAMR